MHLTHLLSIVIQKAYEPLRIFLPSHKLCTLLSTLNSTFLMKFVMMNSLSAVRIIKSHLCSTLLAGSMRGCYHIFHKHTLMNNLSTPLIYHARRQTLHAPLENLFPFNQILFLHGVFFLSLATLSMDQRDQSLLPELYHSPYVLAFGNKLLL